MTPATLAVLLALGPGAGAPAQTIAGAAAAQAVFDAQGTELALLRRAFLDEPDRRSLRALAA